MRKLMLLLCVLLLSGCSQKEVPPYIDGEYIGVGSGKCGSIQVKVTITEGNISAIDIIKSNETKDYMQDCEEQLIPKIIENNSTEGVDVITGATESSNGILHGVYAALQEAKNDPEATQNQ